MSPNDNCLIRTKTVSFLGISSVVDKAQLTFSMRRTVSKTIIKKQSVPTYGLQMCILEKDDYQFFWDRFHKLRDSEPREISAKRNV